MPSGIKLTFEQVAANVSKKGLELLEYTLCKNPVKVKCKCSKIFTTNYHSIIKGLTTSCGCKIVEIAKSRIKNIVGHQYGRWKVLAASNKASSYWCECKCGTKRQVTRTNLIEGKSVSCGCFKSEQIHKRAFIDLTNKKIGKLTVLQISHKNKRHNYYWLCLCECGNLTKVSGIHLRGEKIRTCGHCGNFRNGKSCSYKQQELAKLLESKYKIELNYRPTKSKYTIDIFLSELNIAIEYDEWFWHAHTAEKDKKRNQLIKKAGYKLLVIRTSNKLPSLNRILTELNKLISSSRQKIIITLSSWGKGLGWADKRKLATTRENLREFWHKFW